MNDELKRCALCGSIIPIGTQAWLCNKRGSVFCEKCAPTFKAFERCRCSGHERIVITAGISDEYDEIKDDKTPKETA